MRTITTEEIIKGVRDTCIDAACNLGEDAKKAIIEARDREESPTGREVLSQIIKNFEIAESETVPMCQDTGITVVFVEIGAEVHLEGPLEDAINEGVRRGYKEGYLRKSVCDPLTRVNTKDNTPAIIHTRIVAGDKLRMIIAPKGGGSENMSALRMFKPSDGIEAVKDFVVDTIKNAGGNPCPPTVVGVGIGGSFEKSAIIAKKAVIRPLGQKNADPEIAAIEDELLERINALGIGPMGLGGSTTAFAVHVETHPCHIASLPVAINVQCHADRHKEIVL